MIISIFASIWSENLWDELILKNEIKILEEKYWKDVEFKVFTNNTDYVFFQKYNIEFIESFPIWIWNIGNIFKNIKNLFLFFNTVEVSDLIVIWWGGIFYDNEILTSMSSLKLWIFRTNIFRLFNKKILFYSVWLNIKSKINYLKLKKIFSWDIDVDVRDKYGKDLLNDLWIKSKIVYDPVFYDNWDIDKVLKKSYLLKKIDSEFFDISDISNISLKWKKVWIAFRRFFLKNEDDSMLKIIKLILKKWWKIIFIPHSFHKEDEFSNDYIFLKKYIKKITTSEIIKVQICKNMRESYKVYKDNKIDICFSMRLHSIILSQVYAIPYVAFTYTKKTNEILKIIEEKTNK